MAYIEAMGSAKPRLKTDPGVVLTQRMQTAGRRASDAYARVRLLAQRVSEELDETTAPHGIQTTELHEEDSLVIVVKDALAAHDR